jgi:hypothetical protein
MLDIGESPMLIDCHCANKTTDESSTRFLMVMYESVCKLCWGEREWGENGFQIWPRIKDRELVEGKA